MAINKGKFLAVTAVIYETPPQLGKQRVNESKKDLKNLGLCR